MPYRTQQRKRWTGTTLPGSPGCWATITITLLLLAIVGGAFLTWKLSIASGWMNAMTALVAAHGGGLIAAIVLFLVLKRSDRAFKHISALVGRVDLQGDQLNFRAPGFRSKELRFELGKPLEIRCASSSVTTREPRRTLLMLQQGETTVVCASSGEVKHWQGGFDVAPTPFQLPRGVPILDVDHESMEDMMRTIDERLRS